MATRGDMIKMEHWAHDETPRIDKNGHQTHYPVTPGGRSLRKPHKGKDGGGKRAGKRKFWLERVQG